MYTKHEGLVILVHEPTCLSLTGWTYCSPMDIDTRFWAKDRLKCKGPCYKVE